MTQKIRFLLLLIVIPFYAYAEKPVVPELLEGTTVVTVEEVYNLITTEPNLVVIDSRRNEEHDKGHIEGSISILDSNMTHDELKMHVNTADTPILFYCNGVRCMRSYKASVKAISWGYRNIYWFRGGWKEWKASEMPISQQ